MNRPGDESRAFSLVEVVVALGVFVAGVVTAIVLLSTTAAAARRTLEANTAVRVAQSSIALVRRLPWDDVLVRSAADSPSPVYATREGNQLGWIEGERGATESEPFYQLDLTRNAELSPESNDEVAGFVALRLRISWPVRGDGGEQIDLRDRESLEFNLAVRR